jgi:cytosine/uracil/thiamine/allantoin permease
MKVVAAIIKVLASIFMIPVGILCGAVFGVVLLLLLVLAIPIHFVEEIWNPDDLMERWD